MTLYNVCMHGVSPAVCPLRTQQLISKNKTLLPDENVQASSEDTLNPVENFLMYSNHPWCTAEEDGSHPGHFIDLNFTEPIVLTYVESDGFINGYVDNFTIEYTQLAEGDHFNTYGVTDDQQASADLIKIFHASAVILNIRVTKTILQYISAGVLCTGDSRPAAESCPLHT